MQGLIDCGKYKVTEVLSSHSGFEAALCSDVTVNDGTVYIVNEYSSMVYTEEIEDGLGVPFSVVFCQPPPA